MERLHHMLEHPAVATMHDAKVVETATVTHFTLEHHTPARLLTPIVARHLTRVTALLIAAQHAHTRDALTISAGRTTLLAGWLAFDRGNTPASLRYWDTAISTAEGSGDDALLAAALTFQSYAAARSGDPASAWQLALSASKHTPNDLRATAWATSRIALHAAQQGELNAAHDAMTDALERGAYLKDPKPGDRTTPWTRSFGRARLLATTAHTAGLLKEPNTAHLATQAVEALNQANVKARALVLAEAALAATLAEEPELAARWAIPAATLTRDLEVSIAADLLHEAATALIPYADNRTVREVLPHLNRLPRTTDPKNPANRRTPDERT
jgi:hypothetical protein